MYENSEGGHAPCPSADAYGHRSQIIFLLRPLVFAIALEVVSECNRSICEGRLVGIG